MTEIPYFDGDFWPNVIEETIKELDQEAKQREASEKDIEVSLLEVVSQEGAKWNVFLVVNSYCILFT